MSRESRTKPPQLRLLRLAPLPGEIGHPGTCPLCSAGKDTPPCLACRDELRARLLEMSPLTMTELAMN